MPIEQKFAAAAASNALFTPVQTRSSVFHSSGSYREWRPGPGLRDWVCCYWYLPACTEGRVAVERERMVPDGCMDLIVQLDRASGQILGFLVGTVDHPVFVPAEDTRWDRLGIRLYPGGLQRFLKEPGYLFTNRICRLADINKTLEAELADCMLSASSVEQLISAVHRCLLARVHGGSCWEDTFRNILHHLFLAKGNLTVHELSRRECVSGKQLGRIFLERTGLSTKAFAQIIRFQHVLRHLNLEANPALIQAALQHGYYDQAHFIHEFAGFSGLLPSDYVKRSE